MSPENAGLALSLRMFLDDLAGKGYAYAEEPCGDWYLTAGHISDRPVAWEVTARRGGRCVELDADVFAAADLIVVGSGHGSGRYRVVERRS